MFLTFYVIISLGDFMSIIETNSLVLAYLGDAIYEIYVRKHLISLGINKVNDLQEESKKYVSAKSQALFLKSMLEKEIFSEEEISVIKRGRNSKVSSHPKNIDIVTYKHATALEALIGYLYLNKNNLRIEEIMNHIWSIK